MIRSLVSVEQEGGAGEARSCCPELGAVEQHRRSHEQQPGLTNTGHWTDQMFNIYLDLLKNQAMKTSIADPDPVFLGHPDPDP